jgi:hypothetical protein
MKKISKLLFLFALLACSVNLQAQLAVPYSEVPSFSTVYAFNSIVLTGDLQSFNITNGATSGQVFAVKACQDTQGGHVIVSGPNNFAGNLTIDKTPNACTTFNFTWNGIYWVGAGSPSAPIVYPHPSGQYADLGVPTFTCVSPCTYTRLDAPQGDNPFYTLIATAKTISTNWVELGGGSSGGSGPSQVNVTFTADGDCDLTNPINCTLTTETGGAVGPDSFYTTLVILDPGNVLTALRNIWAPENPGSIYTVANYTDYTLGFDTLSDGGYQQVIAGNVQGFVNISGSGFSYYTYTSTPATIPPSSGNISSTGLTATRIPEAGGLTNSIVDSPMYDTNGFINSDNPFNLPTGSVGVTQPFGDTSQDVATDNYVTAYAGAQAQVINTVPTGAVNSGGIAIDSSGNLWVGHQAGIDEISSTGIILQSIPIPEDGYIQGVSIDNAGNIWAAVVLSGPPDYVIKFSSSGTILGTFNLETNGEPFAIAFDGSDNAWVTCTNSGSVWELSNTGTVIGHYTEFSNFPEDIVYDSHTGNIWVSQRFGDVNELSSSGAILNTVTTTFPTQGMAISNGTIWVYNNALIAINTGSASIDATYNLPGVNAVSDMAFDPSGNLWMASNLGAIETKDGNFIRSVNTPAATFIATDSAGNAWVSVNTNPASVQEIGPQGISASALTLFQGEGLEYQNGVCSTAASIVAANGINQAVTLTNGDTCALTITQPIRGTTSLQLKVTQSSTSSFNGAISGSGITWLNGSAPTIPTTSGAVVFISCYLDGVNSYCRPTLDEGGGSSSPPAIYTVSTLPAATSLPPGTMVEVSDTVGVSYSSTSFTQTTCTGGGTNYAIAITDGTNWSCH